MARSFHEDMVHFDCESKIEYDKYPNCALVKFYAKLGFHHYNWLEGFDYPGGIEVTYSLHRLMHFNCEGKNPRYAYPQLVKLYAKLGGKNLKFCKLKSFNMRINCGASSYYITLDARCGFPKFPFQVLVNERMIGCLDLAVSIARPRTHVIPKPYLRRHCEPARLDTEFNPLPDWPPEIAFSDAKRFYMVNKYELQNNGWISLYLELALVSHVRDLTDHYLAQLEIVQVAVETVDDVKPPTLDSKNVVIYIVYRDFAAGEPCDSKAIVRRSFNEVTEGLKFVGDYWSEEKKALSTTETASVVKVTEKRSMHLSGGEKTEKRCKKKKRLGVHHRLWRLSDPRCHQAYKSRASARRRQ
ncbi:hypothetical protein HID58_080786 [Brassica napus]|uniref:Histone acetyltransferase n=1 Tax=Brassica napus TaxID=3708 RepID=A0ABQ7Y5X0_BRANA|nr:hypothetical protein HID58_080786 [Brassica napus]